MLEHVTLPTLLMSEISHMFKKQEIIFLNYITALQIITSILLSTSVINYVTKTMMERPVRHIKSKIWLKAFIYFTPKKI